MRERVRGVLGAFVCVCNHAPRVPRLRAKGCLGTRRVTGTAREDREIVPTRAARARVCDTCRARAAAGRLGPRLPVCGASQLRGERCRRGDSAGGGKGRNTRCTAHHRLQRGRLTRIICARSHTPDPTCRACVCVRAGRTRIAYSLPRICIKSRPRAGGGVVKRDKSDTEEVQCRC